MNLRKDHYLTDQRSAACGGRLLNVGTIHPPMSQLRCNLRTERNRSCKLFVIVFGTTFSNGCLGSHYDEERSEMRYVMRIARPRESQNLSTHIALSGFSREHACLSVWLSRHWDAVFGRHCGWTMAVCGCPLPDRMFGKQTTVILLKLCVYSGRKCVLQNRKEKWRSKNWWAVDAVKVWMALKVGQISCQVNGLAEFKHIIKRRKRH